MPLCKNHPSKRYTGKENTPLGRGYSASVEEVGSRRKGRDGKMYTVVHTKNGRRWRKLASSKRKTSPRGDDDKKNHVEDIASHICYQMRMREQDCIPEELKNDLINFDEGELLYIKNGLANGGEYLDILNGVVEVRNERLERYGSWRRNRESEIRGRGWDR